MYRNKKLCDDSPIDILDIAKNIQCQAKRLVKIMSKRKTKVKLQLEETWTPPPSGFCKINFDAAFDGDFVNVGIVLRNPMGDIVVAWTGIFVASNPFEEEAIAALQALKWEENRRLTHIIFLM